METPGQIIPHSRPTLGQQEAQAAARVIASGQVAQGAQTQAFEREMARTVQRRWGRGVSSGTAGLHLALLALGVGPGHEVIIPGFVCAALINAVRQTGAEPIVADIEPETYNLDPDSARKKLSGRTRAIILAHMFGLPGRAAELARLGPPLIEDCAQTLGADMEGRPVGSVGTLTVMSFYATKVITTGEGGMVLGDDERLAAAVSDMREYDEKEDYRPRFNYKTTDIASAMGRVQLGRLEEFIQDRKRIAKAYLKASERLGLGQPRTPRGFEHTFFRFVVAAPDPAALIRRLELLGVASRRPVFRPPSLYLDQAVPPACQDAYNKLLSLPIYPSLRHEDAQRVMDALAVALRKNQENAP